MASSSNSQGSRAYGSHGCLLRLGGLDCGFVAAMGGGAYGEVVEDPLGVGNVVGKHLGAAHYEDIVLTCTEPPGEALDRPGKRPFPGSDGARWGDRRARPQRY